MRAVAIALLLAASALGACGKYGPPVRGGDDAAAAATGGEVADDDAGTPGPGSERAPDGVSP
jgi:hypothetical protein